MPALLSTALAQQIVLRTMAILSHNINVMNNHGIIIGSGQTERLGQRHEGAILTISQNRITEVSEGSERHLQGVKPGVNLPLRQDGQVIGVIGITGNPDEVRQYGELVRMAAEMMLEQSLLQRDIERDSRLSEELVLQLIEPNRQETASLQHAARRLGIDLDLPRVAVVIHLHPEANQDSTYDRLQTFHGWLNEAGHDYLAARNGLHEFILLCPALDAQQRWQAERFIQPLEKQLLQWQNDSGIRITAALGHFFAQPDGIALSYLTAHATLQKSPSQALIQSFDAKRLPVLLSSLATGWQAALLNAPLMRLDKHDRSGTLRLTLETWFAHDLHLTPTAAALSVHRNTLDYRLQRIADLTRLNLSRLEDRVQLYIALQMAHH